jgi:hypothetical protein
MNSQRNAESVKTSIWRNLFAPCAIFTVVLLWASPRMAAQEVPLPPRADNASEKHEPFRMIGNIEDQLKQQLAAVAAKTM